MNELSPFGITLFNGLVNSLFLSLQRFRSFQVLKVPFARKWRQFTIGKNVYFAVASNSRSHDSPVFKWNGNMFSPFQTLPTVKAFDIEPFKIGQDTYLAVAIYYGRGSLIFKWDGQRFVKFQEIAAVGADVEHFEMNGTTYLAITGTFFVVKGMSTLEINSVVLKVLEIKSLRSIR